MVVEENQQNDMDPNEEIEKRKPKPFRYISDINELNEELSNTITKNTVMVDEKTTSKKLRENFENTLGVGDIDIVEQVLKKHKNKRDKNRDIDIA
ncbi:hypothetical protein B6U98_03165 [Thermoplasmatales archaeon ex4572_165]|nr:MAG: hypothetical protein B6U98_03165 [Thermoplasmatales archaeon ex4572_165]